MNRSGMPAAAASSDSVRDFLVRHLSSDVELGPDLAQGEWSRAYSFRHHGQDLVIRFNPDRHAFDIDLQAARFATQDLPIPAVIEVGAVEGGFFAITERVLGDFFEELTPATMRESLPSVLAILDALREADTSGSTGFGPWNPSGDGHYSGWRDYLLRNIENEVPGRSRADWGEALDSSAAATRAFDAGMTALTNLLARCPDIRHVVHSDLLNRNVFVAGGRVTGVIDWQCAMYGDFLYDLAWLTFWAPWHPGVMAVDIRRRALDHYRELGLDMPSFAERLRCYEIHIGLRHLVYGAWRGNATNLEATARRTLEVIG